MIQFSCDCGEPLEAPDESAGRLTRCPRCGRDAPVPGRAAVQPADAPRARDYPPAGALPGRPTADDWEDRRGYASPATSGKAVAGMVLGLLSMVGCTFFTGVPAIVFGALGLRDVGRGQGRVRGKGLAITGLVTGAVGTLVVTPLLIYLAIGSVREAAARTHSSNNLKIMALSMHDYESATGTLPPAAICDKATGKPLLSWRVAILPYVESSNLYSQFKLDEAWDGPNNSRLIAQMPKCYTLPGDTRAPPGYTCYRVFYGNGAAFELNQGFRLSSFPNGTSQTILIVEAGEPVPWTKPDELPYDPAGPLPPLGGHYRYHDGFWAAMGDGSVRWVDNKVNPQMLRGAIERGGGMPCGGDW
jgi:hypothetical protein